MKEKDTLNLMASLFSQYLEDLYLIKDNPFVLGEITAYTECLELISECDCINKKLIDEILNKYKL